MDSKEISEQIYYLDFIQRVMTGDPPELKILGSGKVSEIKLSESENIIYIVGDGPSSDDFIKGYRQAVADIQAQLKDRVVKKIEEDMFSKGPAYDFKRDYHGEFKKKEG